MKVVLRSEAENDLAQISNWISNDNPAAALRLVTRIRDRIALLELDALARMGRSGVVPGMFELIEHPYVVVYRIVDTRGEIEVVGIVHGARDR